MNARHMLYTRQATIDRCHTLSICLNIKGRAPVSGIHICYAALSIGKTNLRRSDFTTRLEDHKYLPAVTNPYEKKQANPETNTAISKGNGLLCWI